MTRNPIVRPAAATGFVALLLLVTACGGGSGATATAATSTTSTTVAGRGARLAAFTQCMKQHGVTLPANFRTGGRGPGATGGTTDTSGTAPTTTIPAGVTPQQWQAALTACNSTLPPRGNVNNPQFQLYYNCLQTYLMTHGGTTLPPLGQGGAAGLFGGGGGGAGAGTGGSATTAPINPTLQAARDHCAALRPTGGGGATTSTSIG